MYDVIIIGMGPSGMSAGIYAERSGLNTLILEGTYPGGLLNKVSIVDNYLGIKNITGPDLVLQMMDHIKEVGVKYKREKVLKISSNKEFKEITTTKNIYQTKAIIFAIGRIPKKGTIINEDKFEGKGISYCALCDGPLYKNKDIIVLGGGNSAFEEALYLSKIVRNVKILVRKEIDAEDELIDSVKETKNIDVITNISVTKFIGNDVLTGAVLSNGEEIKCDGAFIYFGYDAETAFFKNLKITDEKGYIIVDEHMRTKIPFIYACGDIIKKEVYQIITGASEGAIAAISAKKDIKDSGE